MDDFTRTDDTDMNHHFHLAQADVSTSETASETHFQAKPIQRRVDETAMPGHFAADLHPVVHRVLRYRGVYKFSLNEYAIEQLLPPTNFKGLQAACDILYSAFQKSRETPQRILVVGDFDVDGATSVVVALRGLKSMGFDVDFFIPDRFKLGYGLSPAVVEAAKAFAPDILITVDNGIASVEGVAAAKAKGWQVIITDHHLAGDEIPAADAIVNPNQPGCTFASKNLAGVGVIFYLLIGLRAKFRQEGVSKAYLPNLAQLLDIVALGTVADVVPLDENNRRLVSLGLARMRSGYACLGLQALAEVAGRELTQVTESDLGFAFGPRLNAAGRLDDMGIGVRCLLSETWVEALEYARQLDTLNRERRGIQQQMQDEADVCLAGDFDVMDLSQLPNAMLVFQPDWHQGIVGLLASRLKDRWHRPVIALAKVSDTELKGSGRSIPGVHLRDALDLVSKRAPHVLNKFGGHAMAAGLTLNSEHFDDFQRVYQSVMDELISPDLLAHSLVTDGPLTAAELCLELAVDIEKAGPWGQAFPEPAFDGEFKVLSSQWLKEKHLKLVLEPVAVQGDLTSKICSVEALYFNVPFNAYHPDEAMARAQLDTLASVHCVYKLQVNRFRGQMRLQLIVDYLQPLGFHD